MKGTFIAKVINHYIKCNEKGNHSLLIHFTIDNIEGLTEHNLYLTEKAIDRTLETLKKCFGWDGVIEELNEGVLIDKNAEIVLDEEEYNGNQITRVKYMNPACKKGDEVIGGLLAQFGNKLKSRRNKEEATPF